MAGFLYFVESPQLTAWDQRLCDQWTLGDTLGDTVAEAKALRAGGPGGGTGYVCRVPGHANGKVLDYLPGEQQWRKAVGEPYWVGYYADSPPTADDLRRPKQLVGHECELAGSKWQVPLVRVWEGESSRSNLPSTIVCNDDGRWVPGKPVPQYARLLDVITPYWDAWHEAFTAAIDAHQDWYIVKCDDPITPAVELLRVNYRLHLAEASMLGLFAGHDGTVNNARDVLALACDCPRAMAWMALALDEKKTADRPPVASGSNLALGDAA